MIHHPAYFDPADKVMLTYSMMTINKELGHISPGDIGFVDQVATLAATFLPGVIDQRAGWDGAVWWERLEATHTGSLAQRLLSTLAANLPDMPDPEPLESAVYTCVQGWVVLKGLPLSFWGKRGPML